MKRSIKNALRRLLIQRDAIQGPPIWLFATPRGGSTWLAETLWSARGLRLVSEPLNLRDNSVVANLGFSDWAWMYNEGSKRQMQSYFAGLLSGQIRDRDALPVGLWASSGFPTFTKRTAFKVIHGASDRIPWLCEVFGGKAILLLRHPLATAVSREVHPFLDACMRSDFYDQLSERQRILVADAAKSSDKHFRGVVAWCLFNVVPLRERSPQVLVVTFEQLVLQPEVVLTAIAQHCQVANVQEMLRRVAVPSRMTRKSDADTKRLLARAEHTSRGSTIVQKWKRHVDRQEESRLMSVCDEFGITCYRDQDVLPGQEFWLGQQHLTLSLADGAT